MSDVLVKDLMLTGLLFLFYTFPLLLQLIERSQIHNFSVSFINLSPSCAVGYAAKWKSSHLTSALERVNETNPSSSSVATSDVFT